MDLKELQKKLRQQQELLDIRTMSQKIQDALTSAERNTLKGLLQEFERHNLLMHPPKPWHELILSWTVRDASNFLKGINLPK